MNRVCAHLLISGKVQGVFFRAHTQEKAQAFGLNGWVRNLPTGQVETVLNGNKKLVDKMIQWCRHGPPSALVTKIDIEWEKPCNEHNGFDIK
jgi:acylphosphatase